MMLYIQIIVKYLVCKTKYKNKYIILSAIDNLIKGGSGQGVQNMNILFEKGF